MPNVGPGQVGLACASLLDMLGQVFRVGWVFWLWVWFFRVGSSLGKKTWFVPPVDHCGSKTMARTRLSHWSGRVGLSFFERVKSGWSGQVAHAQVYPRLALYVESFVKRDWPHPSAKASTPLGCIPNRSRSLA